MFGRPSLDRVYKFVAVLCAIETLHEVHKLARRPKFEVRVFLHKKQNGLGSFNAYASGFPRLNQVHRVLGEVLS